MKLFSKFLFTFTFVSSLTHASTNIEDDLRSTHILDLPKEIFAHILQKGTFNNFRGFLSSSRSTRKLAMLGQFTFKQRVIKISNLNEHLAVFSKLKHPLNVPFQVSLEKSKMDKFQISTFRVLSSIKHIEKADFSKTQISDLKFLSGLINIFHLDLSYTPLTDITPLNSLSNIQNLCLNWTKVSNISSLSSLQNLRYLGLSYTNVADLGEVDPDVWTGRQQK